MEVRFAENKKAQQQQNPSVGGNRLLLGGGTRPPNTSGWLEYVSPEGRPYYYSIQTGHTQWERPVELDAVAPLVHAPHHPNVVPGGVGAQTHGPPGANVFIFHIPNDWSEHDLVASFSPFGQIVSARIATDKGTGRRLGFGFVSFSTIESSVQAVIRLNGFSVSGKRLKVTIKRGEEEYAAPFLPAGFGSQMNSPPPRNSQQLMSNSQAALQPSQNPSNQFDRTTSRRSRLPFTNTGMTMQMGHQMATTSQPAQRYSVPNYHGPPKYFQ
ncbi:uncharacterized protein LOC129616477 [Condylostylus longicornis]|uniref:uncharacterized protein LOC129616477 n=1 Tax=Condylostylus longicornis TaxID=2530218 RepID=UPI00244E0771|nr:uncharacterized protein LOC129616477 [Condylostylus longicornis]